MGAGNDGGIDGVFAFVDGSLVDDAFTVLDSSSKRKLEIELYLIQAKRSDSFSGTALDKVLVSVVDVFDFEKEPDSLLGLYNSELVEKAQLVKTTYLDLVKRFPTSLTIHFVYASKGDLEALHPSVSAKAKMLVERLQNCFPGSSASVMFWGARELLEEYRKEKSYKLNLRFTEVSASDSSYVLLANLLDYYRFVTDGTNSLRRYIFESNVRDYQGDVEVNSDIQQTLNCRDGLDFWWLNNGITVLTSKATIAGKHITLDDVQVVNGLQTTLEIYHYLAGQELDRLDEKRAVLIRVIETNDPEARDRIIKATNHQTKIPAASLRATDRIQRDIEDYFLHKGWYYDRRKNYYKNLGKPSDRTVSIPYLAQAVMAIILREPNNARARPSSLIKSADDYNRVFDEKLSMECYLRCACAMKSIDNFLRSDTSQHPAEEKRSLRFHLAMLTVVALTGKNDYSAAEVEAALATEPPEAVARPCIDRLFDLAEAYSKQRDQTLDQLAKTREFVSYVLAETVMGVTAQVAAASDVCTTKDA